MSNAHVRVDKREALGVVSETLGDLKSIEEILVGFMKALGEPTDEWWSDAISSEALAYWWDYRDRIGQLRRDMILSGHGIYAKWEKED